MAKTKSTSAGTRAAPVDAEAEARKARNIYNPALGAAITTDAVYGTMINGERFDIGALRDELQAQSRKLAEGDMTRMEAMLVAQAHSLDALFAVMAKKAMAQQYLAQFDAYIRVALKAQAQARATVEALAEIKNPRAVAFVRQANIAHGPQQVNNGTAPVSRASEETRDPQPGLLEASNGERLDTGTAGAAGRSDPQMEAVDALDRTDDRRG